MYLVIPRHHPPANLDDSSSSQIIFEGCARLDNQLELALSLGISKAKLATLTDQNLALESYEKWGRLCVDHLLGDFAFAVFNPAKGNIFCARDHIGIAPFYYCLTEDNFVFSDNVRELVEGQFVPAVLDDHSVCCYLRDGEFYHREKTFYRDVKKLPPAHTMRISSSEQLLYEYWSLENCGAIECESQRDCSDQRKRP